MQQYFLNATAIWLISLVLFDVFLKKESYHGYNRFYLLFTFLLGALLPLWQWQDDSPVYTTTLQHPIERVITAKQTIVTATIPDTTTNWTQWITFAYLLGILVAVAVLIVDIIKIVAYYKSGKRSVAKNWTIVETGKEHAPFSLFHILFVCSREQYSEQEWNMILTHEKRHTILFHFADLLLMQAARIVFWFHPLVYIYNRRLLLVHEYQADGASSQQPQVYGKFLVEQAVLQSAPSISHSFNRSPIKNRIVMLTRRSSAASKSKMLVFLPLALVCIVCFSKNSFSQKFVRNGNIVTYKGNKFELSEKKYDTVIITDPVTGKEETKTAVANPKLIKMNGDPIYDRHGKDRLIKDPYFTGNYDDLRDYLIDNLKEGFSKMGDGIYTLELDNIVIDQHGKIVYFDCEDIKKNNAEIDKDDQKKSFNKICQLMQDAPAFIPAVLDRKKVISIYHIPGFWTELKVANHRVYDGNKEL